MEYIFRNFMENIKIYKSCPMRFCASSSPFSDINISLFYIRNVVQGHGVQFSEWSQSMANITIYKTDPMYFCISSNRCSNWSTSLATCDCIQ